MEFLQRVARAIVDAILYLMRLFPSPSQETAKEISENTPAELGAMEAGDPALLWVIMEKVAYALLAVMVVVFLYLLAKRIPRLLRRLRDKLRSWLSGYIDTLNADYSDESESLSGRGDALVQKVRARLRRLRPPPKWRDMDNRLRVRSVYTRLLRSHPIPCDVTARDAIGNALPVKRADSRLLAESYDRARYSDHPITDEDAANAKRAL